MQAERSCKEEPALQEGFPPQATGVGFPPGKLRGLPRPGKERWFPDLGNWLSRWGFPNSSATA